MLSWWNDNLDFQKVQHDNGMSISGFSSLAVFVIERIDLISWLVFEVFHDIG